MGGVIKGWLKKRDNSFAASGEPMQLVVSERTGALLSAPQLMAN
jgi:hypothetical protein